MEDIIKGLFAFVDIVYRACEISMPFMIIHIYNKINEIERKLTK